MESLDCVSSFVKERIEDIYGVLNVNGVIPIVGIVAYKTSIREYSIKEKWLNVGLNVLSMIPATGDLVTLIKKSSIVINSELEGFKESVKESCRTNANALKRAKNMNLMFRVLRGKTQTGATGLVNVFDTFNDWYLDDKFNDMKEVVKKGALSEEIIITKNRGEILREKVKELRICTDGKATDMMKKSDYYKDKNHGKSDTTSCFGGYVSADEIPYIVVPKGKGKFKFSIGVIIDSKGNYLYCVVAEIGPKDKGMGEVSIYAAWKMNKWRVPPETKKNGKVRKKYMIGNKSQKQKNKRPWRIILFEKSSPNSKESKCGWKYKNTEEFKKQIVELGIKCYVGIGKCLN